MNSPNLWAPAVILIEFVHLWWPRIMQLQTQHFSKVIKSRNCWWRIPELGDWMNLGIESTASALRPLYCTEQLEVGVKLGCIHTRLKWMQLQSQIPLQITFPLKRPKSISVLPKITVWLRHQSPRRDNSYPVSSRKSSKLLVRWAMATLTTRTNCELFLVLKVQ